MENQVVKFSGRCDRLRSMSVEFCVIGVEFGSVTLEIDLFAQFIMLY
jgi:hypothetical protein